MLAPPENKDAGAGFPGVGNFENVSSQRFSNTETRPAQELERITAELALMADWRDQLAVQIERAELLLELGCLTADSQDRLVRRVKLFTEAADALAKQMHGRLVIVEDQVDQARRAAA